MTAGLIRTIQVGCKQLGIDAEDRRAMQLHLVGKASLSDMSDDERARVLEALKEKGFKPHSKGRFKPAPRRDLRLVHVMWTALGNAGVLTQPGRVGLNAFIRSRFEKSWGSVPRDVDDLRDHDRIATVIDALKAWIEREGVDFDWDQVRR